MRMIVTLVFALSLASEACADDYFAAPQVVPGDGDGSVIEGSVFDDRNRDGARDEGEAGVAGVLVSNGLDWTATDADGRYRVAVREDMDLTIVQPRGWRVPTDNRRVPQFFYVHKPGGSPEPLRFGGLPDTGPAPSRVDFPLVARDDDGAFGCAIVGDSQTYSNREIGWLRDGVMTDLQATDVDCLLYVGDVVGDDLDLLDRVLEVGSTVGAPQWLAHGNHDFDFDASADAHSADSWRRMAGPNYYAFERGDALFVVLDNVVYPCAADDGHDFCGDEASPTYNGRIDDTQMRWLEGLLERTPEARRIVIATHVPLVSFVDADSQKHQTDNTARLHALLDGRPALSLSGHTHTIENHSPGQTFAGWNDATGVEELPFRHIVVGASSGAWYQGDFDIHGNPMALQRMGAPPGVLLIDFEGSEYRERYLGARQDPRRSMWLGLNTPAFRDWFSALNEWRQSDEDQRHPIPPASINDLPDTGLLTPDELAEGVWLTANVWNGSAETEVTAALRGGRTLTLERTQPGDSEGPRVGAEWADPFAAERQMSVARFASLSRNGEARAQGLELFNGAGFGPVPPRPQSAIADRNMHLWRVRLPADLETGVHRLTVTARDRHDREYSEALLVEVRDERPPMFFRREPWESE